jgi:hypothetical protein
VDGYAAVILQPRLGLLKRPLDSLAAQGRGLTVSPKQLRRFLPVVMIVIGIAFRVQTIILYFLNAILLYLAAILLLLITLHIVPAPLALIMMGAIIMNLYGFESLLIGELGNINDEYILSHYDNWSISFGNQFNI